MTTTKRRKAPPPSRTRVQDAGLPCRLKNFLLAEGLAYMDEAQALSAWDLLRISGVGPHGMATIQAWPEPGVKRE